MIAEGHSMRRWFLPLSLAVNVFLLAVMGSRFLFHPFGPPPPPDPYRLVEEIARTLPEADGNVLRLAFVAEGLGPEGHGPPHELIGRLRLVLRTEPFDAHLLETILTDEMTARNVRDAMLIRAIVGATRAMSAEGRHRLADWHDHHGPPPPR
jgi:hypothetical protein